LGMVRCAVNRTTPNLKFKEGSLAHDTSACKTPLFTVHDTEIGMAVLQPDT